MYKTVKVNGNTPKTNYGYYRCPGDTDMSEEVVYIKETKEFIVNGRSIKEDQLTETEAANLRAKASNQSFLVGTTLKENNDNLLI